MGVWEAISDCTWPVYGINKMLHGKHFYESFTRSAG